MKLLVVNENLDAEEMNDNLIKHVEEKFPDIEIEVVSSQRGIDESQSIEAWNSVMMYRFKGDAISENNTNIIGAYKNKTHGKGIILPVSYADSAKPPGILGEIKANKISDFNAINIISKRLASYLGILCLGKDHTVFVSYRASDGKTYAKEVYDILKNRGFNVFLDEAKDADGEGAIPIGQKAQDFIDKNLERCSVLVLIDTPDIVNSEYVLHEIETANSLLIPILPICFSTDGSATTPRFLSLSSLKRYLNSGNTIDEENLVNHLSDFLNDIYLRKKRVSYNVEQTFKNAGYSWDEVDVKRLYFSSEKQRRYTTKSILSHCPIHKGLFPPYISTFSKFNAEGDKHFHFRYLIYDGEVLNRREINQLKKQVGANNVEVLHHQEIQEALEE